jgi:hypothetical protein
MIEAARSSETMVNFYQTTRRYNSEDSRLPSYKFITTLFKNGYPLTKYQTLLSVSRQVSVVVNYVHDLSRINPFYAVNKIYRLKTPISTDTNFFNFTVNKDNSPVTF